MSSKRLKTFSCGKALPCSFLVVSALLLLIPVGVLFFKPTSREHILPSCQYVLKAGKECPSCGLTRSILSLYQGNIKDSIAFHPGGIALVGFLVIQIPAQLIFLKHPLQSMMNIGQYLTGLLLLHFIFCR